MERIHEETKKWLGAMLQKKWKHPKMANVVRGQHETFELKIKNPFYQNFNSYP
jgi:hypothetical protein